METIVLTMERILGKTIVCAISATTVLIGNTEGDLAVCAHGYMAHNAYSSYHGYAWGGLVAVAQALRGRGLARRSTP